MLIIWNMSVGVNTELIWTVTVSEQTQLTSFLSKWTDTPDLNLAWQSVNRTEQTDKTDFGGACH
jgi:hypothetical protein